MFFRLFVADLKILTRNKQALFWALAFPLMFATIFGLFNFDRLPEARIAVIAEDPASAGPVIFGLTQVPALHVCGQKDAKGQLTKCAGFDQSEQAARKALHDGDLSYVLIIPRNGHGTVIVNRSKADQNRIFVPIFERVLDNVNIALAHAPRRYTLSQESASGQTSKYYDFVLPGLVGMAVMTYGIIGLASTIAQYRGQKILRRILATPLRPSTFLGAIVTAHLVLAIFQSAIVLAWGIFVFHGNVRGNVLAMLPFIIVGNLTFLNIGFMVASRVKTTEAASGLGNAVSMPMMFFSGVFFPTSTLPWILPAITVVLPLHPLVDAVRAISVNGESISTLMPQLLQLVGWAVGSFIVASRMFRFEQA